MNKYDVIVIGAGNGGLAAAATLAEKGKKTILFEKHNIPGGCGTSFRRGRFEFEVALHQLSHMGTAEKPGPLREQFRRYGIEKEIDWIQIEELYRVNFLLDSIAAELLTQGTGLLRRAHVTELMEGYLKLKSAAAEAGAAAAGNIVLFKKDRFLSFFCQGCRSGQAAVSGTDDDHVVLVHLCILLF